MVINLLQQAIQTGCQFNEFNS